MAEESEAAVDRLTDSSRAARAIDAGGLARICDHCDIPLAYCVHGNPPKPEEPGTLLRTGPTIIASTYSECPGCGEQITLGEEITLTEDGWAHAGEVDDQRPPATSPSVFDGI